MTAPGCSPTRLLRAVAAAFVAIAAPGSAAAQVTLDPVPASPRWPDAAEPGALRMACAGAAAELRAFFEREALPFRPELVRREAGRSCHIFYRPTRPGFRAAPDDDPLTGVLFDTDPLAYLAAGSRNRSEPVVVMREILQRVARPLDVTILLHFPHDPAAYEAATRRSFGATPHRIKLLDRGVPHTFWWVQDYVKTGVSNGGATVLVPRRIYEGEPETGGGFDPMLDRFARQDGVARSRLSWEGGDLQFTRDPRDTRRLVLYYGRSAKPYWAATLAPLEYEHVLEREFGADRAIDLGGLAPHVDYFVSFLPRAGIALVGVPVSGDRAVAIAAVDALASRFAGPPPPELVALRKALSAVHVDPRRAGESLERARAQQSRWQLAVDPTLPERMEALVKRVCPDGVDCLSAARQQRLLEADAVTFGDWLQATQSARDEAGVIEAHLDIVESQLDPVPGPIADLALRKIRELEDMGFRVVRIPAFRVDLVRSRGWPGISYVNALVVDRQVFVPRFGLGPVEDRLLHAAAAQLPAGYDLVAIDAQDIMIRNGGLHCLAGLVR